MDLSRSGRLFASQFQVTATDAIVDPALEPNLKYTTGPYGRAAWLLTQIRSQVGDQAFWGIWRRLLTTHAFGTITGDEVLAAFRPLVGDAVWQRATKALSAKKLPQLAVAA